MSKTNLELQVSTIKTTAVVLAEKKLKKTIAKFLRQKGLSVTASDTLDYVIATDEYYQEGITLAQKNNAKILLLSLNDQSIPNLNKINWRIIKTGVLTNSIFFINLIKSAIKNQKIVIDGNPNQKIYPLHPKDLTSAIWQALILPGTANQEFTVLGKPTSLKEVVNYIQQLAQTTQGTEYSGSPTDLKSDFDYEKTHKTLNWEPKIKWQEALENLFQDIWRKMEPEKEKSKPPKPTPPEIKVKTPENTPKPKQYTPADINLDEILADFEKDKPIKKPPVKKTIFPLLPVTYYLLLVTSLFIISVWLKAVGPLFLAKQKLSSAWLNAKAQSWGKSLTEIQTAKKYFAKSDYFLKNSGSTFFLAGAGKTLGRISEIGYKTCLAAETSIPLAKNSLDMFTSILRGSETDLQKNISSIKSQGEQLNSQLAVIQGLLDNSWKLPPRWKNLPLEWHQKIGESREKINKNLEVIDYLPWLVGSNGEKRTYLVLLQNNMELRPTGGFIGSFALLSFQDGTLIDFRVENVYDADGQLKGHVEPPKEIKEILGEANWYLRDANWNPEFSKTAKNVEWFLNKETGRTIDGVIGFNLEAAKKFVDAFNEVYLADFDEKINADNLFERAEFWSENESFTGSNQKQAFLSLLGQQLFENIKAAEPTEYFKIIQAVYKSLTEKEILIYTHNQKLNTKLHKLNWDGNLKSPTCGMENCFQDYLYLVEANLGINKANYFLNRKLEQSIDFQKNGQISHKLKINYENTATSNNWPGGKYINWLRLYLPTNTQIQDIKIYDPISMEIKKTIGTKDRSEKIENNKEVIGFKVEVPINEKRVVEINFSQKANTSTAPTNGYLLYWQKQSGYQETPVSLLVSFPDTWQPLQVKPAASLVSGKLLFNQTLDKDLTFGIEFGQ